MRQVIEQIKATPSSDGDGVQLLRVFGGRGPERFDPFLMLDEFGSNEASDYIGGFPSHPHRGFETITYMLQGKMEHQDHMGNIGLLADGDVQWMTAGRGIIHSEMPKQTEGKMRGFQVWLNLPAEKKMCPAHYTDLPANKVPAQTIDSLKIKAIAGEIKINGNTVNGHFNKAETKPVFIDLNIEAGNTINIELPDQPTALVYVYEGQINFTNGPQATKGMLSRLSESGAIEINNKTNSAARIVVLAGKPLKEPIAQYGPFVMNTPEEIEQAMSDYRNGTLTQDN